MGRGGRATQGTQGPTDVRPPRISSHRSLAGLLTLTLLAGCTFLEERPEASLLPMWRTYVRCRSSQEPLVTSMEARRLLLAASLSRAERLSRTLPAFLVGWLPELPSRLSVDPDAMAADCLHRARLVAQEPVRVRPIESQLYRVTTTHPDARETGEVIGTSRGGNMPPPATEWTTEAAAVQHEGGDS